MPFAPSSIRVTHSLSPKRRIVFGLPYCAVVIRALNSYTQCSLGLLRVPSSFGFELLGVCKKSKSFNCLMDMDILMEDCDVLASLAMACLKRVGLRWIFLYKVCPWLL